MSINRNNYEEFFMLYADGELSFADRQAVDRFVMENPDLAEELELYGQLQLPDEIVSFAGKESLYRIPAGDVTADNHEEKFLLYVDDELDEASKEKVERFVLQNPAYQESFTLLKQTRLPAETVIFEDKASLYRKEEKRPVAYMRWVQMAAAAAFIGLAVLVWTLLPHDANTNSVQKLASLKKGAGVNAGNKVQDRPIINERPQSSQEVLETVPDALASTSPKTDKARTVNRTEIKPLTNDVVEKQPDLIALNKPVTVEEKPQTGYSGDAGDKRASDETLVRLAPTPANTFVNSPEPHDDESATIVHNAVYKELDTDDEKKSLYLGSLEINKDKLRGFFRKAGSLFRSKSKQQEEDNSDAATPASRRTLK